MDARIRAVPRARLRVVRIAAIVALIVLWAVYANVFHDRINREAEQNRDAAIRADSRARAGASARARDRFVSCIESAYNQSLLELPRNQEDCIATWQASRHADLSVSDRRNLKAMRSGARNIANTIRDQPHREDELRSTLVYGLNGGGR